MSPLVRCALYASKACTAGQCFLASHTTSTRATTCAHRSLFPVRSSLLPAFRMGAKDSSLGSARGCVRRRAHKLHTDRAQTVSSVHGAPRAKLPARPTLSLQPQLHLNALCMHSFVIHLQHHTSLHATPHLPSCHSLTHWVSWEESQPMVHVSCC